MKIALVFDGLGFGGIERVGLDYIKLLREEGHEIDVYNANPKNDAMKDELPQGVKYFPRKFSGRLCPDRYAYGVKKWWWGKYAYPAVYAPMKLLLYFRRLFSRRRKYDVAIAFAGHFRDLTFVAYNFIRAPKKLCWLHGNLAEYLLVTDGFGTLYRKIKNLVVLSDLSQDAAIFGSKFLKVLNIHKIYNPSFIKSRPLDNEKIAELKEKHGGFLLFVARFSKQKDHKTVINAVKILREKYGLNNKVMFVGDGDTKQEIENYAAEQGVADACVFEGGRSDVQNYYSAASVFVHSSPFEGLPTTLIEAMSLGVPIVATNSLPGVSELLENGKYGVVVPVGDAEAMAENVAAMLMDANLREKYIASGLERSEIFSPDHIKKSLLPLLGNEEKAEQ